ncbi:MAG: amino acid adenylation domain-containing protein [Acidobacteriota bacterium]|nr:amino acid adenylation domain-containing protein [Acidobacteriota bacterium]
MTDSFPCSQQQSRIFAGFEERIPAACLHGRIPFNATESQLRAALDQLLNHEEIPRTTYKSHREDPSRILQIISAHCDLVWEVVEEGGPDDDTRLPNDFPRFSDRAPLHISLRRDSPQTWAVAIALPATGVDVTSLVLFLESWVELVQKGTFREQEPLQHADYAGWQADTFAEDTDQARRARDHWRKLPESAPGPFSIPGLEHDADSLPCAAEQLEVLPEPGTFEQLAAVAASYGRKTEDFVFACFVAMMQRLSGKTSHLAGRRDEGRKFDELKHAIGAYAQIVPFREMPLGKLPIRDGARLVASSFDEAEEFAEYFQVSADKAAHEGFFPILMGRIDLTDESLVSQVDSVVAPCAPCFFELLFIDTGSRPRILLNYDPECIDESWASRLAKRLTVVIDAACAEPEALADALPLLTDDEKQQFLKVFNVSETVDNPPPILDSFSRMAAAHPERPALVDGDRTVTYARLAGGVDRLAEEMGQKLTGAKADDGQPIIAVRLPRGPELICAFLACWQVGAAYLPVDPELPPARLKIILNESGADLLVGEAPGDVLPAGLTVVPPTRITFTDEQPEPMRQMAVPKADQLAYVLFTSGSTGTPKGVAITHAGLANYTAAVMARMDFEAPGDFVMISTPFADLGNTMLFPALVSGGALNLIDHDQSVDAQVLGRRFAAKAPDYLKIVPGHLEALLTAGADALLPRKVLVLGGDKPHASLIDTVRRLRPDCRIFNHYGPTETVVGVMALELTDWRPACEDEPVPLGRPLANNRIFILNPEGVPVPPGTAGEICIAGDQLARGYINRDDLTQSAFVTLPGEPLGLTGPIRLYKTGDRASFTETGLIRFLGRMDDQLKIRGHRVELGEINAVLKAVPGCIDASVIADRDENDKVLLAAFYVTRNTDKAQTGAETRAFLSERLPDYMVPEFLITLPKLPLSANGKLDRAALREHLSEFREQAARGDYQSPVNETERLLCEIFAEIIGLERVSAGAGFFQLGGDSIDSILVVDRARDYGMDITAVDILSLQTPRKLAAAVKEIAQTPPDDDFQPFQLLENPDPTRRRLLNEYPGLEDAYPLSPTQQGMLFYSLYEDDSRAYLEQKILDFYGVVNPDWFADAWTRVLNLHPILRTGFVWEDMPEALQFYETKATLPFSFHDLRDRDEESQKRFFEDLLVQDRETGFQLNRPPLLRFHLLQLGEKHFRMLWTHHHILLDGWSLPVVYRDFLLAYQALSQQKPFVGDIRKPYRDFIAWLGSQDLAQAESFWREELKGLEKPGLLAGAKGASVTMSDTYATARQQLEKPVFEQIGAWARDRELTLNNLFLGAWILVQAHVQGMRELVVGVTASGRPGSLKGVDSMVGLFITSLPVRMGIDPQLTAIDWLHNLQTRGVRMRDFEYTPLNQLRAWSGLQEETLLFDNLYIYENQISMDAPDLELGFRVEPATYEAFEKTNYALIFQLAPREDLGLLIMYDRDLFAGAFIRRLLQHFQALVLDLVQSESLPLEHYLKRMEERDRQWDREKRDKRKKFKAFKTGPGKPAKSSGMPR